jgi:acetolactate synthase I/II/III large subunit
MKASDYIISYLYQRGVTHIFEVIGGMITHLVDSADRHGQIKLVSVHHEQAAAFAAHGMGYSTGVPGVAMATSGPGAVNLLTGIGSCYFDSIPAIFITGQVNLNEQKGMRKIRQLGFQETDIVSMARPITKAAMMIQSAAEIPEALGEAFRIALSDRPGPVLLDIPMDIQRMDVPVEVGSHEKIYVNEFQDASALETIFNAFNRAKKPLVLAGGGINSARVVPLFRQLVDIVKAPVVNSLLAVDALPYDHPQRVGLIGSYGNRWANIALGSCDMLLVLGSRLDIRQTGADVLSFQSEREIFHVDCEDGEINNRVKGCIPVHADLRSFLPEAINAAKDFNFNSHPAWENEIKQLREKWPDTDEIKIKKGINPNRFMHELSRVSNQAMGFVVDTGNHQMWAAQSLDLTSDQKFITSGGMGAMGFSLPAAIGAGFASPRRPIVQIAGDGGMQMNIQELETIAHHKLPIKMVVLNNHSYGMVRQFQQSYFHERYASTYQGYSTPDFERVALAYGIQSMTINETEGAIQNGLSRLWADPMMPFLLQVEVDPMINAYPKIAFGYPITQMEPFAKPLDMEGT